MKSVNNRVVWCVQKAFMASALFMYSFICAQGQAPDYGSSPYSDQKYDGANHLAWYQEPFLWVGLILLILVIGLVVARRRQKYT